MNYLERRTSPNPEKHNVSRIYCQVVIRVCLCLCVTVCLCVSVSLCISVYLCVLVCLSACSHVC